jgi:arsenate reductase (thioredoxin)
MIASSRRTVLFLCTGNSCRSQMAEALVNARLGDRWQAFSAGTRPTGEVHPLAIRVLSELGIQHQGQSKSTEAFRGRAFDLVVTVCDDAAEDCPVWLGQGRKAHLSFKDPAKATGTPEQILAEFRSVLDQIAGQVPRLLEKYED